NPVDQAPAKGNQTLILPQAIADKSFLVGARRCRIMVALEEDLQGDFTGSSSARHTGCATESFKDRPHDVGGVGSNT
ncbi:MAG: hypothetical protein NZO58_02340, partial [Gemmataceae bacterium]|nr:hypothetical protein [Gemmataceae bacterium]